MRGGGSSRTRCRASPATTRACACSAATPTHTNPVAWCAPGPAARLAGPAWIGGGAGRPRKGERKEERAAQPWIGAQPGFGVVEAGRVGRRHGVRLRRRALGLVVAEAFLGRGRSAVRGRGLAAR